MPTLPPVPTCPTAANSPRSWALSLCLGGMLLAPQLFGQIPPMVLFSFPTNFYPAARLVQARDGCLYGTTLNGGTNSQGTVFRISADASSRRTLYSFTGVNDGANPYAGLIQARNGALYGTTVAGGVYDQGTLFRITTNGTLTTLYSFTGNHDGGKPYAPLVQGADGSFYGTTSSGGAANRGTVFKLTPQGAFVSLYAFSGSDGAYPFGGLVQGPDGNLYGTTVKGGAGAGSGYDFGTVFRLHPEGGFATLHSFTGSDGAYPYAGLIRATNGQLYGTTAAASTLGSDPVTQGTLFRISPSGLLTVLYTFTGGTDGTTPFAPLFQASDGFLYGTTTGGANTNGTLFRLTTEGAFTSLAAFTGPNGAEPYAGLVQGLDGNLYGTAARGGTSGGGTVFRASIAAPPFLLTQPLSQATTNRNAVTFSVLAGGSAPLSYQWLRNGRPLTDSDAISGATSSTLSLGDVSAADAGTYSVLLTNAYGRLLSSNALLSVTVLRPVVTLLSPASNTRWSNAVLTVAGKATGPLGVESVFYQLNDSGWHLAHTTNGWSRWTAQVELNAGTNIVQIYAKDSGGRPSLTNTLKLFYVVSAPLTVQTNGRGSVTPNYTGKLLELGRSYPLQATPARGFVFTSWTGSLTSNAPKLNFLMQSNLSLTANFVDVTRPATVLLSPKANLRTTNALLTLSGRASDNDAVASVVYQLNDSEWTTAQSTNQFTNWTAVVTLTPGTNILRICAIDTAGRASLTNSPKCFFVVLAPLAVQTIGRGTVTPNYSGKLLELGRRYTLQATPASGFRFSHWSGSLTTNAPKLSFLMQSNLSLTANFVDVARPAITLLSPKPNQRTTNALFTVSGRASDNGAIASVRYQLNGADWLPAQTTNNWANWTAVLSLSPGTNVLRAYAIDAAGNCSPTNRVNLIRIP